MAIEIRILQPEDASILNHVAADVFDDPIIPQSAQDFLHDAHHHLILAIENGIVIGFASGVHTLHPDKPRPEFWINEIGVSLAYQNRGIGKALMQALFEVARSVGCIEAWVLTERENQPAMRLYKSIGGDEEPQDTVMFTFQLEAIAD